MATYWIFVPVFFGLLGLSLATDKRILLNDNDVYQQIQEIQTLKAQFSAFQTKITSLENTVNAQQTKITKLESTAAIQTQKITLFEQQGSGAVYTRWGRLGCPTNDTELVYSGYAGGGMFDQSGSAPNYVCLPHDPYHFSGVKPSFSYVGHMYGAEYQDNVFDGLFDKDVPCAVCLAKHATSVLMIPGKNTCNAEWKLEYTGILSAEYFAHPSASEYVCVDIHPEALDGGYENKNGKLFYPVIAKCGSLRCPPYKDGEVLSCAVCSK